MTSTPVRTVTLSPSIVTVSPIRRAAQVCPQAQLHPRRIHGTIEQQLCRQRRLAGSLNWFLRRRKHEIIHRKATVVNMFLRRTKCKIAQRNKITAAAARAATLNLRQRKNAQLKKIAKARVERERKRLQIDSGAFNAKAWRKRRKVTTEEKSLQLDHDHFLLNPSQQPLQGERILKRE